MCESTTDINMYDTGTVLGNSYTFSGLLNSLKSLTVEALFTQQGFSVRGTIDCTRGLIMWLYFLLKEPYELINCITDLIMVCYWLRNKPHYMPHIPFYVLHTKLIINWDSLFNLEFVTVIISE